MNKPLWAITLIAAAIVGYSISVVTAQPVKPPIPATNGPTTAAQFATVVPIINPAKLGSIVENQGGACVTVPIATGAVAFNLGTGNTAYCTAHTANITAINITNCPGTVASFNWVVQSDGVVHVDSTSMWLTANIFWPNGVAQAFTINPDAKDVLSFKTFNGCATWQVAISSNYGG